MTALEDLYYGNIHPCERDMPHGSVRKAASASFIGSCKITALLHPTP